MTYLARNGALAEELERRGDPSADQIARAVAASKATGHKLEDTLLELGILPDDALADLLADWLELERHRRDNDLTPMLDPAWGVDPGFLRSQQICAGILPDGGHVLLMADPRAAELHQMMTYATGLEFSVFVATAGEANKALDLASAPDMASDAGDRSEANARDIDQLAQSASEGPIVRLAQQIMLAALDARASDIHIEAEANGGQVRLRIDGRLSPDRKLSEAEIRALQSRLKVMAGLNISELRRPQDGRIRQSLRGVPIDFRLSSLPTQFGESLVMRVLDQRARPLDLAGLGFTRERAARLDDLFNRTEGLLLVTGPTGSGKTTTLYTGLTRLDAQVNKIITIEDPIEYTLPNICQTQIHPEIGYDLPEALRSVLRQDINVVLVGEIRDRDTAQNAVRIAMTGRLVASTLTGVLSQRLVRRADGSGRIVVSELFEVTDAMAQRIADGMPAYQIAREAALEGHESLTEDGARLVADGLVTRADLEAVLIADSRTSAPVRER